MSQFNNINKKAGILKLAKIKKVIIMISVLFQAMTGVTGQDIRNKRSYH